MNVPRPSVSLANVNQTTFIFGTLAAAYLFYITARGDLAKWLGLLGLGGSTAVASSLAAAPALPALPPLTAGG